MPPVAKLVRLHVADGRRDELLEMLEPVRQAAEGDAGTVMWTMHAIKAQPNEVFIYERYRDQAAADAHDQLPALKVALQRTGPCLAAPPEVIHAEILAAAE
jgi:quinol monooxygenase YgiN